MTAPPLPPFAPIRKPSPGLCTGVLAPFIRENIGRSNDPAVEFTLTDEEEDNFGVKRLLGPLIVSDPPVRSKAVSFDPPKDPLTKTLPPDWLYVPEAEWNKP